MPRVPGLDNYFKIECTRNLTDVNHLQVGAKCRVELVTDTDRQLYTCHIQKISIDKSCSIVYIEHFGKKFLVGRPSLLPHPRHTLSQS